MIVEKYIIQDIETKRYYIFDPKSSKRGYNFNENIYAASQFDKKIIACINLIDFEYHTERKGNLIKISIDNEENKIIKQEIITKNYNKKLEVII